MIIGISGKARAGKDTIANYLVKAHDFTRIAFADALKEGCRQIFGLTDDQLYGDKKEVIDPYWNLTPRYILQFVGTECLRNGFDKNIWIKAVEKKITEAPTKNWVISDCRFNNEFEAIKRWNGQLVCVERPLAGATGGIPLHASEVELESYRGWDYIIQNDISVHACLYDKIELMLQTLDKDIKLR